MSVKFLRTFTSASNGAAQAKARRRRSLWELVKFATVIYRSAKSRSTHALLLERDGDDLFIVPREDMAVGVGRMRPVHSAKFAAVS